MLPRLIGPARAKELFFTARRRINSEQALAFGVLQKVVQSDELLGAALAYANDIESTSPLGLAAVKQSINLGADLPWDEAVEVDQRLRRPLEGTRDYEEGISAHFEKRKPVFIGQ
jgi:enoyl-CoA hydratase/carnithine racemase